MSKNKKIIISIIVAVLIILAIVFRNILIKIPAIIEYSVVTQNQINIQKKEVEERASNPATNDEIEQMKEVAKLCFHNADCISDPLSLEDCNSPTVNKYFCTGNSTNINDLKFECVSTLRGCIADRFEVCENNMCMKKTLDLKLKYNPF